MPRPPTDRLRILAERLRTEAEHETISDAHNFFGDLRELCHLVEKWTDTVEPSVDEDIASAGDVLQALEHYKSR